MGLVARGEIPRKSAAKSAPIPERLAGVSGSIRADDLRRTLFAQGRLGALTNGQGVMGQVRNISVYKVIEDNPKLSGFDLFWQAYPKKKAKGDAMKAWQQTFKHRPPIEQILAAIETQRQSNDWWKDSGAYIPYPASWLRAWRWADE